MSSEERQRILKMVEGGRISAEQALQLIKVLAQGAGETKVEVLSAAEGHGPQPGSGPDRPAERSRRSLEATAARARRLWTVPLWLGVAVSVLSAYWLYGLVASANYGFWFYFAWVPFLAGVALIALGASSRTSRWLFVRVDRSGQDWPRRIAFGFPLPPGLAAWAMRTLGGYVQGSGRTKVDEILQVLSTGLSSDAPLILDVDESAGGERVQVYIG